MRLTFAISSLSCGGAERALSVLANSLDSLGYQVTVITIDTPASDFYQLRDGVARVSLGMLNKSANLGAAFYHNFRRLHALRQSIIASRPDAVIGFMSRTSVLSIEACLGLPIPVIASEQLDPRMGREGRMWELQRKVAYPRLAALVSASHGVDVFFSWLPAFKRHVIPNPLADVSQLAETKPAFHLNHGRKQIISMGRLVGQKGFDLLIEAFSALRNGFPNVDLTILGEGPERRNLEELVARKGLTNRVFLPGQVDVPFPILRQADLFVLSSRFEGFGNVLCEALACGLPVVSFACPSGPAEIIRDGVDGVLVPPEDVDSLTQTMTRLMADDAERTRLAACATEGASRFGAQVVVARWEDLLKSVTAGKIRK